MEMRFSIAVGLLALVLPVGASALPDVPDLGESGQEIELPDEFFDHYPPDLPPVVPTLGDLPTPDGGLPEEGVVPPSPVTPAGPDAHPLGGAPPFGLGSGSAGPPSFVPEPSVALMLTMGFTGLAFAGRARRRP